MEKFVCHHVPETSLLYTMGIPKPIAIDNVIQIVDIHYTTCKQCFGNGLSLMGFSSFFTMQVSSVSTLKTLIHAFSETLCMMDEVMV